MDWTRTTPTNMNRAIKISIRPAEKTGWHLFTEPSFHPHLATLYNSIIRVIKTFFAHWQGWAVFSQLGPIISEVELDSYSLFSTFTHLFVITSDDGIHWRWIEGDSRLWPYGRLERSFCDNRSNRFGSNNLAIRFGFEVWCIYWSM